MLTALLIYKYVFGDNNVIRTRVTVDYKTIKHIN